MSRRKQRFGKTAGGAHKVNNAAEVRSFDGDGFSVDYAEPADLLAGLVPHAEKIAGEALERHGQDEPIADQARRALELCERLRRLGSMDGAMPERNVSRAMIEAGELRATMRVLLEARWIRAGRGKSRGGEKGGPARLPGKTRRDRQLIDWWIEHRHRFHSDRQAGQRLAEWWNEQRGPDDERVESYRTVTRAVESVRQ